MTITTSLRQPLLWLGIAGMSAQAQEGSIYRAELKTESEAFIAGRQVPLAFSISDAGGNPVSRLENMHEKPVHLIVVSSDLHDFAHLHPEQTGPGAFSTTHVFSSGGEYLLFLDFAGPSGQVQVERFRIRVSGDRSRDRVPFQSMAGVSSVNVDGATIQLNTGTLAAGTGNVLTFSLLDSATRRPVDDLQPYLGEAGHFVIISEDGSEFVHAHPIGHVSDPHHGHHDTHNQDTTAEGEVRTMVEFPSSGHYKIWAQFRRNNRIIVAPFVVRVGSGGEGN